MSQQDQQSLIHDAIDDGDLCKFRRLANKKKYLQSRDITGLTPLHKAVIHQQANILRYILTVAPSTVDCTDFVGRTPLHFAAALKDKGYLYKVLTKASANPDVTDQVSPFLKCISKNKTLCL